jgi:hypothetical protein
MAALEQFDAPRLPAFMIAQAEANRGRLRKAQS